MPSSCRRFRNGLIAIVLLFLILPTQAGANEQILLAWDPSDTPDVAGYHLLYGTRPSDYTALIDVGNRHDFEMPLLPAGTYYIVVRAYTADGTVSSLSNELALTIGPPTAAQSVSDGQGFDLDGDGYHDLLWQHDNGQLAAWMLQRDKLKAVSPLSHSMPAGSAWRIVGAGDFDADGRPDLLWRHSTEGWLAFWFMDGRTLKSVAPPSIDRLPDTAWRIVGVADLNGDKRADILWRHENGSIGSWLMDGTTVTSIAAITPNQIADTAWKIAALADLDGDGHVDIIWRHDTGALAAWLMKGISMRAVVSFDPAHVDPAWKIASVIDANKDGKADIVWQHDQGWIAVWYLNGTSLLQTIATDPPGVADVQWRIVGPR